MEKIQSSLIIIKTKNVTIVCLFVCLFVFFSYPTFVRLALSAFGLFFYTNGCKFSYARFPKSATYI